MDKNPILEEQSNKIGDLLLKYTSLTSDQLDEALILQAESGKLLGEILLKKNFIHPHDIVKVMCHQANIPYQLEIKLEDINESLINELPINYAKLNECLPIIETERSIVVAVADPFNENIIKDLQQVYSKEINLIATPPLKIQEAINRVYEKANQNLVNTLEDEFEENLDLDGPIDILDAGADEAPVIRFVNSIIFRAVKEGASDIHIEPYDKESIYRFRINGIMTEILRQPLKTHSSVTARIKVMAKIDIAEKRLPQDGRIKIKMAGKDIDIRLNTVPVQYGERIVMRLLEKGSKILRLEDLGFHGKVLQDFDNLAQRKHGVLYVSGPTGSGKTTTLSAVLDRINSPDKMIITVEDPVEYEIAGISQIQVNHKIDLSFAKALRAIVRQDPDVIMVGETRDLETAQMAIEASLTGHFVLSTIHTNDAASAPNRLIDMGVQPFLIASSLIGVLAQRLVRTLCKSCRVEHEPTPDECSILDLHENSNKKIYRPEGCPKCNYRGYDGRTTVSELMLISDEVRPLILQKADSGAIKKVAMSEGMLTIRQDAIYKVLEGLISIEELVRVINQEERDEEEELQENLKVESKKS